MGGVDSSAILLTTSQTLAQAVKSQIQIQTERLPRQVEIIRSFNNYGAALVVEDLEQAVELANRIAPEHLGLVVQDPYAILGCIRDAGAIMVGEYTPESVGDYIAGPNHILPTGGIKKKTRE